MIGPWNGERNEAASIQMRAHLDNAAEERHRALRWQALLSPMCLAVALLPSLRTFALSMAVGPAAYFTYQYSRDLRQRVRLLEKVAGQGFGHDAGVMGALARYRRVIRVGQWVHIATLALSLTLMAVAMAVTSPN